MEGGPPAWQQGGQAEVSEEEGFVDGGTDKEAE